MFLPWVVELDWASWKPVPEAKKEAAELFNVSGDELAAEEGTELSIAGDGWNCEACRAAWTVWDTKATISGARAALELGVAMDELPASGAETGTDRLSRDVATTLVLVLEEGAEDTLSAKNAASMLLLVCLDPIENARKTTEASARIKKPRKLPHKCTNMSSKLHDLQSE